MGVTQIWCHTWEGHMKLKLILATAAAALLLAACTPEGDTELTREAVNPWEWGAMFGFNQGEVVSGETRTLYLAGQTAVNENGEAMHAGDIRAQFALAFDNVDAVLTGAGMDRSNVVRITIFTTDVDGLIENWDVYMSRYPEMGYMPPDTLIGIDRLFEPQLMVEIEAVAVD